MGVLMASPPNRRKSVRYSGVVNQACLAWRTEGEADTTQVPARVWDISQSGASILVETRPPLQPKQAAWVRMESPTPSDWVETQVVGVTAMTRRTFWGRSRVVGHLVRVRFVGSCPYDLFKTATHGDQLNATFSDNGPYESDGVIWR